MSAQESHKSILINPEIEELKLAFNTLGLNENEEITAEKVQNQYVRLSIEASLEAPNDNERKAALLLAKRTLIKHLDE